MENLEEKLKYYADNYYNGNELISDEEYDSLVSQLKKENPDSDFLKDIVGDDLKGITKKVKLPITMGTLAKYHTEKEFTEWFNARKGVELIVEGKCDGCLDKDTKLETEQGFKTIEEIVENKLTCKVKAFNFETGKQEFTKIKNHFINQNDFEWYEIELEDGKKIKVTANHKIYLPQYDCWREVSKLKIGDEVKLDN